MTKLEQDLKLAHEIIKEKEKIRQYYSLFDRMWPFTTVNMREYLEPFNLKDKKCITIQGSSDHIFELFLKQPEKIIGIDTNPLTEYYYYLKQASFAVLENSEEYLKFFRWHDYPKFCKDNKQAFDKEIFFEIQKYLIGDSKIFWNELFENHESTEIRKNLFNQYDETNNKALYQALSYLEDENYQHIRQNRDKINFSFINVDIKDLISNLTENYDFLTLSNIILYSHYMYHNNHLQESKKLIETLSGRLNKNGNIIVGYLYDIENENDDRDIYKKRVRDLYFSEEEYRYRYFKKMNDLHRDCETTNHDACLIYTNLSFGKDNS